MVGVLVDTSVFIDIVRSMVKDGPDSKYLGFLLENEGNIFISNITISELWAGRSMTDNEVVKRLTSVISASKTVFPDLEVAIKTGELLREQGRSLSFQDAQLAASALVRELSLLTLNHKDFQGIEGLRLLDVTKVQESNQAKAQA